MVSVLQVKFLLQSAGDLLKFKVLGTNDKNMLPAAQTTLLGKKQEALRRIV